jgi:hypothetical protein
MFLNARQATPATARKRVGFRDDDRISALLIVASRVDPNLAAPATAWCSSNDPQPHDHAQ